MGSSLKEIVEMQSWNELGADDMSDGFHCTSPSVSLLNNRIWSLSSLIIRNLPPSGHRPALHQAMDRIGKRETIISYWMQLFCLQLEAFLLTVELFYLQLTILAFLLTIGAFLLPVLAFCLQLELFCLQWESASNEGLKGL